MKAIFIEGCHSFLEIRRQFAVSKKGHPTFIHWYTRQISVWSIEKDGKQKWLD